MKSNLREYVPDRWVLLKITTPDAPPTFKVFATWYGSFTTGDSWKLSSGVCGLAVIDNVIYFENVSGSMYICNTNRVGTSGYTGGILQSFKDPVPTGVTIEEWSDLATVEFVS